MSTATADRGLLAVRRVREARERDSRIGLGEALAVLADREAAAAEARRRVANVHPFETGDAAAFRAYHQLVQALAETADAREDLVRAGRTVADEARSRWLRDRQAVRTVELLLERRAAERRAARARQEASQLDELASQAWTRAQHTAHLTAPPSTEDIP